ncbi:MAG: hypothetical protein Tsb0021_00690 [Chlamydiales bacterium]
MYFVKFTNSCKYNTKYAVKSQELLYIVTDYREKDRSLDFDYFTKSITNLHIKPKFSLLNNLYSDHSHKILLLQKKRSKDF